MTNNERIPKLECRRTPRSVIGVSRFGFRYSFGFRHSSFGFGNCGSWNAVLLLRWVEGNAERRSSTTARLDCKTSRIFVLPVTDAPACWSTAVLYRFRLARG